VPFTSGGPRFQLQSQAPNLERLRIDISCGEPNWQLSALAQICTSFSPLLSAAESLYIYEYFHSNLDWSDVENTEWLEFLFPFTTVKNLYLSKESGLHIAPALQELTEGGMTAVLPVLQNIFLEGLSHRNLSREALGGSFLADSSPITLLPYLPGADTRSRHWWMMIDVCPLLSMFCPIMILTPINFLCCRRYCIPLHLLFGS
jgi:hypothetical protein